MLTARKHVSSRLLLCIFLVYNDFFSGLKLILG
jgi:hypothetical protein